MPPNKCRTSIVGIQVVYCDASGAQQSVWVDLKKVHALSWCEDNVGDKPAKKPSDHKTIPTVNGPSPCLIGTEEDDVPLCWWDGAQWICGAE